jgi:DnaJ family protein C protein 7
LQQGNRHFQAQEYQQAAAAYSQALALGVDDAALAAVLLCNRAASQHAAGQYLDAIADCCLAHQFDSKYPRALQVSSRSVPRAGALTGWLAG